MKDAKYLIVGCVSAVSAFVTVAGVSNNNITLAVVGMAILSICAVSSYIVDNQGKHEHGQTNINRRQVRKPLR